MADQFFGAFAARLGAAQAEVAGPATLEDVIGDAEVTAAAVEERLELAAGRGFLGGPYVWGLLVLIAVIVLIMIFR